MKPKKILVPIDFSYHANGAIKLALSLSKQFGSDLMILHVDPLPGAGTIAVEPVYIAPQMFEGLHAEHNLKVEQSLREIRDELRSKVDDGVEVAAVRRRSEPVEGIVDFAAEWNADMMIMGSQGTSGISHLLLGSTAEKVSRRAPCPVLIAGSSDDHLTNPRALRRVLIAIDYSAFSRPSVLLGALLTGPSGLLEIVHIAGAPFLSALNASLGGARDDVVALAEGMREAEVQRIEQFSSGLGVEGVQISHYVGSGAPAAAILARAEETHADLIILGAHSRTGLGEKLLGTVADRVLRHTTLPVLLFPLAALPEAEGLTDRSDPDR